MCSRGHVKIESKRSLIRMGISMLPLACYDITFTRNEIQFILKRDSHRGSLLRHLEIGSFQRFFLLEIKSSPLLTNYVLGYRL